jgi:hypothetical protein
MIEISWRAKANIPCLRAKDVAWDIAGKRYWRTLTANTDSKH